MAGGGTPGIEAIDSAATWAAETSNVFKRKRTSFFLSFTEFRSDERVDDGTSHGNLRSDLGLGLDISLARVRTASAFSEKIRNFSLYKFTILSEKYP